MVELMKKMPGYELIGEEERDIIAEIFNKNNGVLFGHGFDALRSRYFVKEFENDTVWHARQLKGVEIEIGKKRLK